MLKDSGVLIRLAYVGLQRMGLDADAILEQVDLNSQRLYDSTLRTLHSGQPQFWQAAEVISGDPHIGLHLGEHIPTVKGIVLEYLLRSSATFAEGLKRITAYQRLLSDALQIEVGKQQQQAWVSNGFIAAEHGNRHLNECVVQALIKLFKNVTDDRFQPLRIDFCHEPGAEPGEYQRIFRCPVHFGQAQNRLYFAAELLNCRSIYAEPELLPHHEKAASEQLARLQQKDLLKQVHRHIAALLENQDVTLEAVARRCQISVRHLRYQLLQANTSFQRELTRYRHKLARQLLAHTDESINEIVYLTGFSEPSTFYRAFKRWEGLTPVEYRKRSQQPECETG